LTFDVNRAAFTNLIDLFAIGLPDKNVTVIFCIITTLRKQFHHPSLKKDIADIKIIKHL